MRGLSENDHTARSVNTALIRAEGAPLDLILYWPYQSSSTVRVPEKLTQPDGRWSSRKCTPVGAAAMYLPSSETRAT